MKRWTTKLAVLFSLAVIFGACSKKEVKEEGDVAGDESAMTDVGAAPGAPIAELETVYFAYDSFNLSAAAKKALKANAEWLKGNPDKSVQVEGHCDERGTEEYNLALGERRAASVKEYLVGAGVNASQLSTISYGEERPSVVGSDESAWSQNRRGSFVNAGY